MTAAPTRRYREDRRFETPCYRTWSHTAPRGRRVTRFRSARPKHGPFVKLVTCRA